ncbi:MAG: iron reductase [Rhizobiaceae bacterium]|nr:iron reductase [Rhizobiaceae bacterium]
MPKFAKYLLNAPLTSWIVLFIPAPALLADFVGQNRYYAEIMYESGLLATQLMILALAITPAMRLCRNWPVVLKPLRWMQKRRRYIGVAAFGYGLLHTIFYIRQIGSAELIFLELEEISLATGWIAFIVLLALAATSNDFSVRSLGRWWKKVQMAAYFAALLTLLHWWFIGQFLDQMLVWFVPLALLQVPRLLHALSAVTYQVSSLIGNWRK